MGEIIDLSLLADSRRCLNKLLQARGLSYFLKKDGHRLFQIEPGKVELVVRAAARGRPRSSPKPPRCAFEYCHREVRRELIRRVVEAMLQTGL
jgi:hypothetical protein